MRKLVQAALALVCRKPSRPDPVVTFHCVPVEPINWSPADAETLLGFLQCETGRKMMDALRYEVMRQSLSATPFTDFEQGQRAGMVLAIHDINTMADSNNFIGAPDDGADDA